MGCGPSTQILINVDRPNGFFLPGETVTGNVQISVVSDELEMDRIDLTLLGEVGYTTRHTTTVNGRRRTRTAYHHKPFLTLKTTLAAPPPGEQEVKFNKGQYSWPFQFQLPEYIPPSMHHPQQYPHVRYLARVLIDKPWYKSDEAQNRFISVGQRSSLIQQPSALPSAFVNHNRKNVVVKGTLDKSAFAPGELITITMEVDNPGQELIKQITMSMIQNEQLASHSRTQVFYNLIVPEMMNRNEQKFIQKFRATIPSVPLLSSFQYTGGTSEVIQVHLNYLLKFDINVAGFFDDFVLFIPFLIINPTSA